MTSRASPTSLYSHPVSTYMLSSEVVNWQITVYTQKQKKCKMESYISIGEECRIL